MNTQVHIAHCYQGEYKGCCKYGDDDSCPASKKAIGQRILVEESALESIKAQVLRVQEERDELLHLLNAVNETAVRIGTSSEFAVTQWVIQKVQIAVDRCTTTPKVME